MIKKHSSIVLKLANSLKKYKLIYTLLKRMYYYFCYIFFISKNNRYDLEEDIVIQLLENDLKKLANFHRVRNIKNKASDIKKSINQKYG